MSIKSSFENFFNQFEINEMNVNQYEFNIRKMQEEIVELSKKLAHKVNVWISVNKKLSTLIDKEDKKISEVDKFNVELENIND